MLNKVLYHIIVFPLSKLPLSVLYIIFSPFYYLTYYVIGYRKTVIENNIKRSFPKMSEKELKQNVTRFYRYLSHLMAESIKNLSISKQELSRRITVENPEIMDQLFDKGKNVILLSSHFNNWELLITAQNFLFKHQAVGIGMPLSNSFWDKKINARRERFGMQVVNSKNYKTALNQSKSLTATLVLGDQSPSNVKNVYWTTFLNQSTAFYFGAEVMANQMDAAVVFATINNSKKGYYSIKLNLITDTPKKEDYGNITQSYIEGLERDIIENPARWLWSHKRWKIQVPDHIETIQSDHKKRFEEKFRSEHKISK